jgi:hypothetical protein
MQVKVAAANVIKHFELPNFLNKKTRNTAILRVIYNYEKEKPLQIYKN